MKYLPPYRMFFTLLCSLFFMACSSDSTEDPGTPNDTDNENVDDNSSATTRLPQSIYDQKSYIASYIMDTDQDGDNDIIIGPANGPTTDILLVNDGGGNFTVQQGAFPTRYQEADGQTVNITTGDFNNDGLLDVIASTIDGREATFSQSAQIHLYLNNGNNTFSDATSQINDGFIGRGWVEWIRVGDFNNDGNLDFVTTSPGLNEDDLQAGNFVGGRIYLNDGNAHFSRTTIQMNDNRAVGEYNSEILAWDPANRGTIDRYPLDIFAGDVDNDGDIDLVAPNGFADGQWATFLNNGIPGQTSFQVILNGNGNSDPYDEAIFKNGELMDINNDGFLDVIGSTSIAAAYFGAPEESIIAFTNNGDGQFTGPVHSLINGNPGVIHARQWVVGDFNADGNDDLFVADHGTDIYNFPGYPNTLLLGNGSSLDDRSDNVSTTSAFTHGAALGDIDNDGDLDIFMNNHQGLEMINGGVADFLLYLNNGNGTFIGAR